LFAWPGDWRDCGRLGDASVLTARARSQRLKYAVINLVSENPNGAVGHQEIHSVSVITPKMKLMYIVIRVSDHESITGAAKVVPISGAVSIAAIRPAPKIIRNSAFAHQERARFSVGNLCHLDWRSIEQNAVAGGRGRPHHAEIVRAAMMACAKYGLIPN